MKNKRLYSIHKMQTNRSRMAKINILKFLFKLRRYVYYYNGKVCSKLKTVRKIYYAKSHKFSERNIVHK